jgi:transcriptional regulator with XRE-family HTH domain
MSRKMIPVAESFAAWRKDPEYVKAYNALEEEFSLAKAMVEARAHAGLTQEQLAERMDTTQAVIARLESGRVKPSTRTLERLAAATGMRLRISFRAGTGEVMMALTAQLPRPRPFNLRKMRLPPLCRSPRKPERAKINIFSAPC